MFLAIGAEGREWDYQLLGHHELRPSIGPMLNLYPHSGDHPTMVGLVKAEVRCAVNNLCPVSFS